MTIQKKILTAYERINGQPIISVAAMALLEEIPIVGTFLVRWYKNIEEKKKDEAIKDILKFLELLQDGNSKIYEINCNIFELLDSGMEKNESTLKQIITINLVTV